ncbi:helix-turn-helix domain-containing protein [Enterococcus faecalis]|nr:helix-turn-helix domain-containing protein [Enterococcus faecalis]EGO8651587.1 DNA-binding protein [Enterococcus faecalis]HDU8556855.1 helix-turn-helix domain-containing protein [Enterococcus faecalis]HDV0820148.1 helix-turn-helix domain-containing protein [Enterococcus faecalis]
MNELTILLSEQQLLHLQETIHQLLIKEVNQFRVELGLNERYIKKNQLCHYLNLSNNTIDKLIMEGLPKINIQGVVLYDRVEVDNWLKGYTQSA